MFRKVAEDELWQGWILRLGRAHFTDPEGEPFARDVVHHPGAVAVVPVHDDGSVTLLHQFRPAVGDYVFEIPAGTCDVPGEPPVATAARELTEEAGLQAALLVEVATIYNSPGFCDQRTTIFVATGLTPCPDERSGVEERWMEVRRLAPDELDRVLASGVADASTALGVRLAREALARGRSGAGTGDEEG